MELRSKQVQKRIGALADNLRAEYLSDSEFNFLDLYVDTDYLDSIQGRQNQVFYGRRGSGKTHLLKAYQEILISEFDAERKYPIYIDLRDFKSIMTDKVDKETSSMILFCNVIIEVLKSFKDNIDVKFIELSIEKQNMFYEIILKILTILEPNNEETIRTLEELEINGKLGKTPEIEALYKLSKETSEISSEKRDKRIKNIQLIDIRDNLDELLKILNIKRLVFLIDEWAEISKNLQIRLAELIKITFITGRYTFKIAAITNRSSMGKNINSSYIGLEEGGDIFATTIDNRYIYEKEPEITKDFFNKLLFKHLSMIDNTLDGNPVFKDKISKYNVLNVFLANTALREILIASAGIPRDFINLFIKSYGFFRNTEKGNRISVHNIRLATVEWYISDKKELVDSNSQCQILLEKIINKIVIEKEKTHFLIPQKYSNNKYLMKLIDFRVIHLRQQGYSHQDKAGEVYDVYSVDYGCYTSIKKHEPTLDTDFINRIHSTENFREIRRVSLEEDFFSTFLVEIGDGLICDKCKKIVDINHLAYIKQNLCNHCYEKLING